MRKVSEPDELIGYYYKCFDDELLQTLQNTMKSILQGIKMPKNWKETNIALKPKRHKIRL